MERKKGTSMRNAFKVAKWEFRRNMKNKSFLIGLFITPAIFLLFMFLGSLLDDADDGRPTTHIFVHDRLGLFETLEEAVRQHQLNWELQLTDLAEDRVPDELADDSHTAHIFLDERLAEENTVPVYVSDEMHLLFRNELQVLEVPLKAWQMKQLGASDEQLALFSSGIRFVETPASRLTERAETGGAADDPQSEVLRRIVPGAFAGIILLSIIFSGMYIFQSASQEKKDKVAELILSSISPNELMQGKIIGYFWLGMVQAAVFLAFAVGVALWKLQVPVLRFLFVPEVLLFLLIAVLGYLLYAAVFVGVGATMADVSTAGNFQGLVFMLPFLPFVFIGPVIHHPEGPIAQLASYIPFSAPGILLLRLSILEDWPWLEIGVSMAILIVSIWIMMKLAGKIFRIGILMYGKNASPREIWKWLRA